ncbi:hypothetical protein G6F24_017290 [Rhizopus arrhizus]|nr:hypothetical protein G6F24_017290 [Rhizopus arrhizus]
MFVDQGAEAAVADHAQIKIGLGHHAVHLVGCGRGGGRVNRHSHAARRARCVCRAVRTPPRWVHVRPPARSSHAGRWRRRSRIRR